MTPIRILFVASLLVSGTALSRAADDAHGLPRSTPEEQGIASSAILGFVEGAEQKVSAVHSFMVVRHGHTGMDTVSAGQ